MSSVFTQRNELEHDLVRAFLSGMARRLCQPDDAFAVCPPSMLADGSIPHAVYRAAFELHQLGRFPTLQGIYAHMVSSGVKGITAADISVLMEGVFCHEEHVQYLALRVPPRGHEACGRVGVDGVGARVPALRH